MIDQDNSPQSRKLIENFVNSGYFSLHPIKPDRRLIHDLFLQRYVKAVLIIPVDYSKNLQQLQKTAVQLIVNGSNSNTASVIINYAKMILAFYSNEINMMIIQSPIKIEPRVWYNPDMESANFNW